MNGFKILPFLNQNQFTLIRRALENPVPQASSFRRISLAEVFDRLSKFVLLSFGGQRMDPDADHAASNWYVINHCLSWQGSYQWVPIQESFFNSLHFLVIFNKKECVEDRRFDLLRIFVNTTNIRGTIGGMIAGVASLLTDDDLPR